MIRPWFGVAAGARRAAVGPGGRPRALRFAFSSVLQRFAALGIFLFFIFFYFLFFWFAPGLVSVIWFVGSTVGAVLLSRGRSRRRRATGRGDTLGGPAGEG